MWEGDTAQSGRWKAPGRAPTSPCWERPPAPRISAQLLLLLPQSVGRRGAVSGEEKVKVASPEVRRKIVAGSGTPGSRPAHSRQFQADTTPRPRSWTSQALSAPVPGVPTPLPDGPWTPTPSLTHGATPAARQGWGRRKGGAGWRRGGGPRAGIGRIQSRSA